MSDEGTFLAKREVRGPLRSPEMALPGRTRPGCAEPDYWVRPFAPAEIAILVDMAELTLPK